MPSGLCFLGLKVGVCTGVAILLKLGIIMEIVIIIIWVVWVIILLMAVAM